MRVDNLAEIRSIDRSNMLEAIQNFPKFLLDTWTKLQNVELPECPRGEVRAVIVGGMGGSAIGGDVMKDWLSDELTVPLEVCRSGSLPGYAGQGTLLIAVSYSGDTRETLQVLSQGLKRGCRTYCVTSGGKMEREAEREGVPVIKVEPGMAPRASLPQLFSSMAYVLKKSGFLEDADQSIRQTASELETMGEALKANVPSNRNPAKHLATRLLGKSVYVYAPSRLAGAARRLKTQLNENSKVHAKFELMPELCHNEVQAVDLSVPCCAVFLRDDGEDEAEKNLVEATKTIMLNRGLRDQHEIQVSASTQLGRILGSILFGDYVSFYLAILRGADPSATPLITNLKRRLGS